MDSNYWSRHGETPLGHAMWFPRRAPPARRGTDPERDEKFEIRLPPAESRANFRSVRLTRAEEDDLAGLGVQPRRLVAGRRIAGDAMAAVGDQLLDQLGAGGLILDQHPGLRTFLIEIRYAKRIYLTRPP